MYCVRIIRVIVSFFKKSLYRLYERQIALRLRCYREKKFLNHLRAQLTNNNFTIIANNCFAGIIYHQLGLPFLSPTINLAIPIDKEYLEFVKKIKLYANVPLYDVSQEFSSCNYPVGVLASPDMMPIHLHFIHYKSFDEAKSKWYSRFNRINYNNMFFIWEHYGKTPSAELQEFDILPINKIVLSHTELKKISHQCVLHCYHNDRPFGQAFLYDGITGKRFMNEWDYVKFLNKEV